MTRSSLYAGTRHTKRTTGGCQGYGRPDLDAVDEQEVDRVQPRDIERLNRRALSVEHGGRQRHADGAHERGRPGRHADGREELPGCAHGCEKPRANYPPFLYQPRAPGFEPDYRRSGVDRSNVGDAARTVPPRRWGAHAAQGRVRGPTREPPFGPSLRSRGAGRG